MRWVDYESDIAVKQKVLSDLQARKAVLETQTDLLRNENLSLDVLDMKSRAKIYVSYPNEMTIFLDQRPEMSP